MDVRLNYSGLVIAGIGFFLTRFTVVLAAYEDPFRFYLAGVIPLVLGLMLAAFGVALTVAHVEASVVRTTTIWCVIGAGTMLILVVLTLLGSSPGDMTDFASLRSRTYLSNFLIGGSVGGTLTGLYASRNRRQRDELRQQTNRLQTLNRLLRHEVLNAVSVIKGHAERDPDPDRDAIIRAHSDAIEQTIDDVRHLTQRTGITSATPPVGIADCVAESVDRVRSAHPEATIEVAGSSTDARVRATDRLGEVFVELVENAVVHTSPEDPVKVGITETPTAVRVTVEDAGPGLPESQQALLETGDVEEFDNPRMGFGLNVARLLVESYRGSIETVVGDGGTTITVELPRDSDTVDRLPLPTELADLRPALPHLVVTALASLVAGLVYGFIAESFGGSVNFIGVYYGIAHPVVGWITHEFHSVVFALMFAGVLSIAPARYRRRYGAHVGIALGWSVVVWFVAAGFVSPIWLGLLGVPTTVPSLSPMILASHLGWGLTLGLLTAFGYQHVAPRLVGLRDRFPFRLLLPRRPLG